MNKTVTVNIGGIVFHIDENAYERFKLYLESIRMHFTASEGRDEIMQDIESRIAEMFQERIKDQKQVITLIDVDEVTELMGKPEQFSDGSEDEKARRQEQAGAIADANVKRRLFRNPDDKLLGGVCSGVSSYFDIDPIWIRLAFAISFFFFGSGLILYIILWIVIPEAKNTADKLAMKGEPVTINNIERNVQEELEQVKKRLNEISEGKRPGNFITRIFEAIIQIFKFFFMMIGKIIAVIFILFGLLVGFVMIASLFAIFNFPGTKFPEIINQVFPTHIQFSLALISACFVIGIPVIMLAYAGARVLFNVKKSSRIVNLSALGLWIAALVACVVIGATVAQDFNQKQSIHKYVPISQPANSLVLKVNKSNYSEKEYERWNDDEWNGDLRMSDDGDVLQSRDVSLDIVKSKTDSFELEQICFARGSSKKVAEDHAMKIYYSYSQIDSVLNFEPFFTIGKDEKYRAQKMQLILRVPVGGKIYLDKSLHRFIYDIKNVDNIYDSDMLERHWQMQKDGLHCLDCTGKESKIGDDVIHIHSRGRMGNQKGEIRIDDNGVYIGDEDGIISIDSNGVLIKDKE